MVLAASWPMMSCRTLPARVSYHASWLIHDVLPREKAWKMFFRVFVITRSRANKRPMVQELDKVCTVNGSGCRVMSLPKTPDVSVVNDYRDSIETADSHINYNIREMSVMESESIVTGKNGLVMMQQRDPQLAKSRRRAPIESNITNCNNITYFMCDGVLMRRLC